MKKSYTNSYALTLEFSKKLRKLPVILITCKGWWVFNFFITLCKRLLFPGRWKLENMIKLI